MNLEKWKRDQRRIGIRYRLMVTVPGSFLVGVDSLIAAFTLGLVTPTYGIRFLMQGALNESIRMRKKAEKKQPLVDEQPPRTITGWDDPEGPETHGDGIYIYRGKKWRVTGPRANELYDEED